MSVTKSCCSFSFLKKHSRLQSFDFLKPACKTTQSVLIIRIQSVTDLTDLSEGQLYVKRPCPLSFRENEGYLSI